MLRGNKRVLEQRIRQQKAEIAPSSKQSRLPEKQLGNLRRRVARAEYQRAASLETGWSFLHDRACSAISTWNTLLGVMRGT